MSATFDPDRGELVWDGGSIILPPQPARLFEAIARASHVATWDSVESALWPNGSPDSDGMNVRVCQLRRRLRDADCPVRIFTAWGRGLYCSPAVTFATVQTLMLSRANVAILRELLETHPNAALVSRAYAALGAF